MKLYHFAFIFAVIALTLFVTADVKTNNYIAAAKEKEHINECFTKAVNDAAKNLIEIEGSDDLKVNRKRAVNDFWLSMYSTLEITDNPDRQDYLKNYVPVIAVTYEDGYYLYYSDDYKGSDHYTCISKRWSEKQPYYYEDDDFIYSFTLSDTLTLYDKKKLLDTTGEQKIFTLDYHELQTDDEYAYFRSQRPDSFLLKDKAFYLIRKGCIKDGIEKSLAYYCNKHNLIAQQCGITYNFALPAVDNSEWSRGIDNPSIIVVFQGYPYGSGVDDTYNRFAISASQINKHIVYYLEQKDWYYIYHKADCPELKKEGIIFSEEPYYSIYDCVSKGAYACEKCCSDGIHVPDYKP